jgi:hypothetical protein
MEMVGNSGALVGVKRDPIYGNPAKPGEAAPILGATVEGSFEAEAIGQGRHEFIVLLDKRELGRVGFDFAAIE